MTDNAATAWMEFSTWLRKEAERRQIPLSSFQPYAGFWAKVSSGRIRKIPPEVIASIEAHFKESLEALANHAGIALCGATFTSKSATDHQVSTPSAVLDPEHEISLVWSDGVPDHMWPYIAFRRGYFFDARIKATMLDAECASDFPEGYGEAMKSCLPAHACGVGTWNEMRELQGWPIALTHHFIGFAAIGRAPSRIKPLERDSPRDLERLMYELSRRDISHSRIACVTENSIEFLTLACMLAKECNANKLSHTLPIDRVKVTLERTPNMLEELYELGTWGWDLVVGHALTHGLAIQNSSRYQVYFTWERLRSIAEKIRSPLALDLERLAVPVPFMLNREPTNADRALVCRLWSVAYRASRSIIGDMPPSAAAEVLGALHSMIPYSNPSDVSISPGVFSAVWHKSYRPLSLDTMLQGLEYPRPPLDRHPSLKRAVRWVLEEKTEAEKLMQRLSRSSSGNAKAALVRAKRFATLGNFYDARLEAERGAK